MSQQSPFFLLQSMSQQALELAAQGLSYATQSAGTKNIAYVVNGVHFYCEASLIKEVAVCENLMSVPQTKTWMRGLINSKGVLYSVSDLSLLAGFERPIAVNKGHLLLINDESNQCALLVNKVIGFRYFDTSQRIQDIETNQIDLGGLGSYVQEGYHADEEDWFCLDLSSLISSEQFREVQ